MIFNSIGFLIFFPIVVLVYYLIPFKVKYIWLLAASYYFYMCWNAYYAILLFLSTAVTYGAGRAIGRLNVTRKYPKRKRRRLKKIWVIVCIVSNLGILFFYKYFNFAVANINLLLDDMGMKLIQPDFDIVLPVGISFYTFKAMSYIIDIYRKDMEVEKNFFKYALYVSFFPQLLSGPIERSKNLLTQINKKQNFNGRDAIYGMILMVWGYFLKVVIADRLAIVTNYVFIHYSNMNGLALLLGVLFFSIQIYCDFNSYSTISRGAAMVMGFKTIDNFNTPYLAGSVADFWRRWHISLTSWFRDYLYIPMGGSRKGKLRKFINILVVFLVSGLWHGANWTFVIWGGLNGVFQVIGEALEPLREKMRHFFHIRRDALSHKVFKIIVTFLMISFTWIFFKSATFTMAVGVIHGIFTDINMGYFVDGSLMALGMSKGDYLIIGIGMIAMLVVGIMRYNKIDVCGSLISQGLWLQWTVSLALLFATLIYGIYGPAFDASAFIYFQF